MLLFPKLFQFGHVSQTCVIFLYFLHELKSTYPRCAICATVPHVYQTWCNLRKMERVSQVLNEWGDVPQCVTTSSYDQARKNKKNTRGAVRQFASIRYKMILLIQVFHVVQSAQPWQSFPNDCQTFIKRRGILPNTRNWQNMLRRATS